MHSFSCTSCSDRSEQDTRMYKRAPFVCIAVTTLAEEDCIRSDMHHYLQCYKAPRIVRNSDELVEPTYTIRFESLESVVSGAARFHFPPHRSSSCAHDSHTYAYIMFTQSVAAGQVVAQMHKRSTGGVEATVQSWKIVVL